MTIKRKELLRCCNQWLQPSLFRDFCPNGLQVEGNESVSSICTAVSASQRAIDYAVENNADLLLVHHGILWDKTDQRIVGMHKQRITRLLEGNCNLMAYHLPLDAHQKLGNNACLASLLDINQRPQKKPVDLLAAGDFTSPINSRQLLEKMKLQLGEQVRMFGSNLDINTIAWCTGAGGDFFDQAIDMEVQAYITGEISERHYHMANESGICLYAAGHHATERYGIQALGEKLAEQYHLDYCFFDEPNPI